MEKERKMGKDSTKLSIEQATLFLGIQESEGGAVDVRSVQIEEKEFLHVDALTRRQEAEMNNDRKGLSLRIDTGQWKRDSLLRKSVAAAAILVIVALSISAPRAALAHQSSDCLRWDESDALRCFDCMQKVWDGQTYHWHNNCSHRFFAPGR
jgi:hypothetical protein